MPEGDPRKWRDGRKGPPARSRLTPRRELALLSLLPGGEGESAPDSAALIVRGRPVDGGGWAGRLFGVRDPLGEALDLPLQPLDQRPLRRDGRVEVLDGLVLMGDADFKLVDADGGGGCV